MERVLDAITQATVEATEAERAVVFPLQQAARAHGQRRRRAHSTMTSPARRRRDERKIPAAVADTDGRVMLGRRCSLAATPGARGRDAVEATTLDLLAIFSSQAAVALKIPGSWSA